MPPPKELPNILRGPGDYEVTSIVHNDTYTGINPLDADLTGKAVFLTGGSRGLGRAMVLSYVRAGVSQIAVGARSDLSQLGKEVAAEAKVAGRAVPTFLAVKLDVTNESSVSDAAAVVYTAFGKIDILVNNAGILGKYGLIADSDPGQWWQVLDVNLRGPYLVTRAFLPLLLVSSGCRYIINVSSVGALLTNPTLSAYQISKNALLKLTALTNAEYSAQNIFAIAVHPGNCPTDIMGGPDAIPPHHKHVFVETPELSADSIVFLTKEQRPWLGGRYINCTWDLPEIITQKEKIVHGDLFKVKFDYDFGI